MKNLLQLAAIIALLSLVVFGKGEFDANSDHNDLRVWFFDVGQGDAILLDTPSDQQVLIDGGPNGSILSELSRALPFGDKDLDLVIVSHNHADHIGGLVEVLRHYTVREIWISGALHTTDGYQKLLELIRQKNITATVVAAGAGINLGELNGIALFPLDEKTGQLPDNQHDANIVTYWTYGTQSILLTGDAEAEHEAAMLARDIVKPATILKVGHHGSRTSTSAPFLNAVKPQFAVIQVGQNNRYGHPTTEVIERLSAIGAQILRTDQEGTILFGMTSTFTAQLSP